MQKGLNSNQLSKLKELIENKNLILYQRKKHLNHLTTILSGHLLYI